MADNLTDVDVHRLEPNYLMGPDWRRILQRVLNRVHTEVVAKVAKDSGALAAGGESSIEVGGIRHDRLIGRFTLSAHNPEDEGYDYAAAHNFGTERVEGSRLDTQRRWVHGAQGAAADLEEVLAGLHA
ncbi:hypothetical protein B1R94_25970 [Mycolicibacterium litorale]|nr:hypothetical protein B1R94_25970 [Mycolicibacterium litorale]